MDMTTSETCSVRDAVQAAVGVIVDKLPPQQVLTSNKDAVLQSYTPEDAILAATRVCTNCQQEVIEKCKCATACCMDEIAFMNNTARTAYIEKHGKTNVAPANASCSVAFDYAILIPPTSNNEVAWRCTVIFEPTCATIMPLSTMMETPSCLLLQKRVGLRYTLLVAHQNGGLRPETGNKALWTYSVSRCTAYTRSKCTAGARARWGRAKSTEAL